MLRDILHHYTISNQKYPKILFGFQVDFFGEKGGVAIDRFHTNGRFSPYFISYRALKSERNTFALVG
jgi:hypothetical protein